MGDRNVANDPGVHIGASGLDESAFGSLEKSKEGS